MQNSDGLKANSVNNKVRGSEVKEPCPILLLSFLQQSLQSL